MSKRILRTVPAAVLVTTALSWNLPAAAQGTPAMPPTTTASGAMHKSPAPRTHGETGRASPATGGAAFGGGSPPVTRDLSPAMPADAASAPGARKPGQPGTGAPAPGTSKP